MKKITTGFTLIELIITIAVIAILVAIGLPGMNRYAENNRSAAQTNLISGTLTLARSEAIKRGVPVTMCVSTNVSTAATPTCNAGSTQWESGWIVYAQNPSGGANILLAVHDSVKGTTIKATFGSPSGNVSSINFKADGSSGAGPGTFVVCPSSAVATDARAINVGNVGLITLATDTDADNIPNDINNTDITCP